ncbi:MAG TPA: methyltransferase domain-containing protein [Mycobacteriales bacterium]|nr:methyltransferase domain-containing protein [Mycobacteriales bacterium]
MSTETVARRWVERWDRQQETYMADREERFAVIADVVQETAGRPDPLVVDLGCGPGSLAARLLDRLPAATVIGIDGDPLLLGLAREVYGDRLRLVDRDLRTDDWRDALGLDRPADAVVSTTALHWLTRDELGATYAEAAGLLRPGGVLVNGDHLFNGPESPTLRRVMHAVRDRRAERVGAGGEDWTQWWEAIADEPGLADLLAERAARKYEHTADPGVTIDDHRALLRSAGFAEVGTVWQSGDDRVLVAVR